MPASGDALLRRSSFSVEETGTDAAHWTEMVTHFNQLRGRPSIAVRYGDLSDKATAFLPGGKWLRGWVLQAHDVPLDVPLGVTHSCAEAEAGRDDPALEAMLDTFTPLRDPPRTRTRGLILQQTARPFRQVVLLR